MKRPNFPYFRAFHTVVSKGNFQKNRPHHGYPFCGDPFGPSRLSVPTKTVPTVPVSDSGSVPGPSCTQTIFYGYF